MNNYCGCAIEGVPILRSTCIEHRDDVGIGDKVRSFDFETSRECYVEGVVCAIEYREGCNRYVITTVTRVFDGKEIFGCSGQLVYPPVNGTRKLFGGVCNDVEKIAEFR